MGRIVQKGFFPALCRLRGQSPNSFPVIVLCRQLGQRERLLTTHPNGPELKVKLTNTLPLRNVTSVTLLFSFFIDLHIMDSLISSVCLPSLCQEFDVRVIR